MNPQTDTLDITPLRRPLKASPQEEPARHPDAAAAARERLSQMEGPLSFVPSVAPAAPPESLVTDRQAAAQLAAKAPLVKPKSKVPSAVKPVLSAVGIFLLLLILLKSPVIYNEISYALKPPATNAAIQQTSADSLIPAEPTISIPKINVYAPVVYEPTVAEANVQKALESGVVHYGNTPAPGQGGNSVIFGHSSNDWWEPGNYKFIFGLLDKLAPGDRFSVDYQSKRYIYEVTGSKVVSPTQVDVLNPTSEPTMTLITCTPPGTSLNRLVVTAKQVDPSPTLATATSPAPVTATSPDLPGAPSGFFSQFGQAVSGIWSSLTGMFGAGGSSTAPAASPKGSAGSTLPAIK